jgi:ATP-dependent DNA helicase PIF1
MTDGHFLNKLDYVARNIRDRKKSSFGGLQMIICGDFLQLPPVSKDAPAFFAFESRAWQEMNLKILELGQVFRQSDPAFLQILSEMRKASLSDKSEKMLKSLERTPKMVQGVELTHLYPLRYQVDSHNVSKLASIPGPDVVFESSDWAKFPTDLVKLDSFTIAPKTLTIKLGAQVMLIKNLSGSLVNGSIGIVSKIGDASISVKFFDNLSAELSSTETEISREEWKIENAEKQTILRRVQYPLLLSYAITIHKAQGQTLPFVKMDLGKVFEQGQAYVAISRATCMEHLQILNFSKKVVTANQKVIEFHASLGIS